MKRFNRILSEVKGENAHREAVAKGLKYRGFGYWEDGSGKVTFKTENDRLVPVDPEVESEMGSKNQDSADMAMPGGAPEKMGSLSATSQMQQSMGMMPGTGQNVGPAPEPGEEQPVPSTLEWEPGPDGSTCVDSSEPPAEVPEDAYVSTTNNLSWGAGPDGSNYSNVDYSQLIKTLREPSMNSFLNRQENIQSFNDILNESAAEEAKQQGLTSAGYGYWQDSTGQVVAQTKNGRLIYLNQDTNPQGPPMTPATTQMGNPTGPASGQTPADKARSMGLISNGSGGYTDQEGNVVAKTVNNELVFYSDSAGGGAISDGSGGAQLTQSAPSWVDPVTGQLIVPPAQPESPEEINAVPDPTPAAAPAGYDAFMQRRKKEMYDAQTQERDMEMAMEAVGTPEERAAKRKEIADRKASLESSGDRPRQPAPQAAPASAPPRQVVANKVAQRAQEVDPVDRALGMTKPKGTQDLARTTNQPKDTAEPSPVERKAQEVGLAQNAEKVQEMRKDVTDHGKFGTDVQDVMADQNMTTGEKIESLQEIFQGYGGNLRKALGVHQKNNEMVENEANRLLRPIQQILDDPDLPEAQKRSLLNHGSKFLGSFKGQRRDITLNEMSDKQIDGILGRADRISEAYAIDPETGLPNPENIRKFKQENKVHDFDEKTLKKFFRNLPASVKRNFGGAEASAYEGFADWIHSDGKDIFTGEYLDPEDINQDHSIAGSYATRQGAAPELIDFINSPDNMIGMSKAVNQTILNQEKPEFVRKLREQFGDGNRRVQGLQDFMVGLNEPKLKLRDNFPNILRDMLVDKTDDEDEGMQRGYFKQGLQPEAIDGAIDLANKSSEEVLSHLDQQLSGFDPDQLMGASRGQVMKMDDNQKARRSQLQKAKKIIESLRTSGGIHDIMETLGGGKAGQTLPSQGGTLSRSFYPTSIRGADFYGKDSSNAWAGVKRDLLNQLVEDGTQEGQLGKMDSWKQTLADANSRSRENWNREHGGRSNGRLINSENMTPDQVKGRDRDIQNEAERDMIQSLVDAGLVDVGRHKGSNAKTLKDILARQRLFDPQNVTEMQHSMADMTGQDFDMGDEPNDMGDIWELLSVLAELNPDGGVSPKRGLTFEDFRGYNN